METTGVDAAIHGLSTAAILVHERGFQFQQNFRFANSLGLRVHAPSDIRAAEY